MTHAFPWRGVVAASLFSLASATAQAQPAVEARAAVSSETVEVGEPFVVELSAMSAGRVPFSDPQLRLPAGLRASSPSVGQKTLVQMTPSGTMFQRGVGVKWQVVASAAGRYTIAPPSIRAGARSVSSGAALRVTVVERGARPRGGAQAKDPFGVGQLFDDPFASLLGGPKPKSKAELMIDEPVRNPDALGPDGQAMALDRGDDEWLFLRVVPDKKRVVVGEQVTLRYREYYRVTNERFDEREPKLPDFLRVPLEDEPGQTERVTTSVGGRIWFVQELNRVAVFPLRAGTLETGTLSAQFRVPYLGGQPVRRESASAAIAVEEPPLEGRPPGYRLGDVGRFTLSASVSPHQTIAGETVTVSVRVEGRGAMPNELRLPERSGIEWLSPEKQEGSDVQEGRVGGWRTFGYAVRLSEAGTIDLGAIELPHYDPDQRAYRVARASLGSVRVLPNGRGSSAAPEAKATDEDPFATLPSARKRPGDFVPVADRAPSRRALVAWLASPTLVVIVAGLALGAGRTWRNRVRSRRRSPERLARNAMAELHSAETVAARAGAAERALHHAIEGATGLKSRGVLLNELPSQLVARGIDARLAARAEVVLRACDGLRFAPNAAPTDTATFAREATAVAEALLSARGGGAS